MEFSDVLKRYDNMFNAYVRNHGDDYTILKLDDNGEVIIYGENKPFDINELQGPFLYYDRENGQYVMKPFPGNRLIW